MPRMPVTKYPQLDASMKGTVILGPCPGCYSWTVEYRTDQPGLQELAWTIEAMLQEHLAECPGLQEIVNAP